MSFNIAIKSKNYFVELHNPAYTLILPEKLLNRKRIIFPQTVWCSSESTLICLVVMVGGHYHLLSLHNIIIRPLFTPVYSIQIISSCLYIFISRFPGSAFSWSFSAFQKSTNLFTTYTHPASHESLELRAHTKCLKRS